MFHLISPQNQIIKEYKVPTITGFSCLRFMRDGSIVLYEKSLVFNSENEIIMNGFENLYEFLTRNMQKHSRDELIFKIFKDIGDDAKSIRIPYSISK